jgi:hypothetical protein
MARPGARLPGAYYRLSPILIFALCVVVSVTIFESDLLNHSAEGKAQRLDLDRRGSVESKNDVSETLANEVTLRPPPFVSNTSDAHAHVEIDAPALPFIQPHATVPCTALVFSAADPVGHPFQRGLATYTGGRTSVTGPVHCIDCPSTLDIDAKLVGTKSSTNHHYNVTVACSLPMATESVRKAVRSSTVEGGARPMDRHANQFLFADIVNDMPGTERARDIPASLLFPNFGPSAVGKKGEFRSCRWRAREYNKGARKLLYGVFSAQKLKPMGGALSLCHGHTDITRAQLQRQRQQDDLVKGGPVGPPALFCPVPYGFWIPADLPMPDLAKCGYKDAYCKDGKLVKKLTKDFRKPRAFVPHRQSPLASGPAGKFEIFYGDGPDARASRAALIARVATHRSSGRAAGAPLRIHLTGDSIVYTTFEALIVLFGITDKANYPKLGAEYYTRLLEVKGGGVHLSYKFFIHACVERFDDAAAAAVDMGIDASGGDYDAIVVNYGLWDVQDGPAPLCRSPLIKMWNVLETALPHPETKLLLQLPAPRRQKGPMRTAPGSAHTYRDHWSLHTAARAGLNALNSVGSSRAHVLDMFSIIGPVMDATDDGRHFHIEVNLDVGNVISNIIAGNSLSPVQWVNALYPVQ